jgi:DNA ligase 1
MFKPMLACELEDPTKLKFPVLVSPKLDGIRCLMFAGVAYSRNMKPIRNRFIQKELKGLDNLDGELIVGSPKAPDCMNATQSGVMSSDGEPAFTYWTFDSPLADVPFSQRLRQADSTNIRVFQVPHVLIYSVEELLEYEKVMLEEGYEGIMVRDPNAPYKQGRSTPREGWLFKLKRFSDGEGVVVGLEPAKHNTNTLTRDELGRAKRSTHAAGMVEVDMIGTILLETKDWGVLRLSPGIMTHAERANYWKYPSSLIGQVVHWRSFGYGVKDKPRFPRFYGIRGDHV